MKKLEEYLKTKNIKLSKEDYNKFESFYNLLINCNNKFNLTAITERYEVILKHFIDSVSAIEYIKNDCLDIGAGAGFPSIPLAIIKKEVFFTAADSLKKRVDFLSDVLNELDLKNYKAVHIRAEDLDKKVFYNTAVSRAVAPLNILCEYCVPFLNIDGTLIAYKGAKAEGEVKEAKNALKELGAETAEIKDAMIEGLERKLIIIKKIKETPPKYPRAGNKPRIKPL